MGVYYYIKQKGAKRLLNVQKRFIEFNQTMNSRKRIKDLIRTNNIPKLTPQEDKEVKSYFKSKGYILKNTHWHAFYKAMNGEFHKAYIPLEIFKAKISPRLNQKIQWPALLDKNLTYILFKKFNQPKCIVQNINGFYYVNGKVVNESKAVDSCIDNNDSFIIKPSLDTGQGKLVKKYIINHESISNEKVKLLKLFKKYKKDFVVQEVVAQSHIMSSLNPSTLNTLRIMTYLRQDGVYILSVVSRIGQAGSDTDNFSGGGIICGIDEKGVFKNRGYTKKGEILLKTPSGIIFKDLKIPNYDIIIEMVKQMHSIIPYFKIISWDIGIDKNNLPILIEYNTYNQSTEVPQIPNGPLFGKFADEILAIGLKPL